MWGKLVQWYLFPINAVLGEVSWTSTALCKHRVEHEQYRIWEIREETYIFGSAKGELEPSGDSVKIFYHECHGSLV